MTDQYLFLLHICVVAFIFIISVLIILFIRERRKNNVPKARPNDLDRLFKLLDADVKFSVKQKILKNYIEKCCNGRYYEGVVNGYDEETPKRTKCPVCGLVYNNYEISESGRHINLKNTCPTCDCRAEVTKVKDGDVKIETYSVYKFDELVPLKGEHNARLEKLQKHIEEYLN